MPVLEGKYRVTWGRGAAGGYLNRDASLQSMCAPAVRCKLSEGSAVWFSFRPELYHHSKSRASSFNSGRSSVEKQRRPGSCHSQGLRLQCSPCFRASSLGRVCGSGTVVSLHDKTRQEVLDYLEPAHTYTCTQSTYNVVYIHACAYLQHGSRPCHPALRSVGPPSDPVRDLKSSIHCCHCSSTTEPQGN